MNHSNSDERLRREAAFRRAKAFAEVLFAGLQEVEPWKPAYFRPIARPLLPVAAGLADALIEAGVEKPEVLARFLSAAACPAARDVSQALWNLLSTVNVAMSGQPLWREIYSQLDSGNGAEAMTARAYDGHLGPSMEDETADEESDAEVEAREAAEVMQWAKGICTSLDALGSVLWRLRDREGLSKDEGEAINHMGELLAAINQGKISCGVWKVDLTLSQGMDDGSSRGTRTYELSIGDGAVKAMCSGMEWERGVGSDSWQGPSFTYVRGRENEEEGDFYGFIGEFKHAVRNADYALSVSLNDEPIGQIIDDELGDGEGERLAKAITRQVVIALQGMKETQSGDGSGLANVWDEICVNKQVEESFFWDAYEESARALILREVEKLPHSQLVELWLLTPEGKEWKYGCDSDSSDPCPCNDEVENYLFDQLVSVAANYVNQRIVAYRDRRYE